MKKIDEEIRQTTSSLAERLKATEDLNFDTYNSLTPNWYYKVLR